MKWSSCCGKWSGSSSTKLQKNYHLIQQLHFWVCIQKNWRQGLKERSVHPASQQHHSRQPRGEATPVAASEQSDQQNVVHSCGGILLFSLSKEILTPATTWMNPEGIVLSELNQTEKKTNTVWLQLYAVRRTVKLLRDSSRVVVARGWGRGNGEMLNRYRVSVLQDETVLEIGTLKNG